MSFSDRQVFYASHDWPNSNVCVTDGCRLVTINNERAVRTWKPSSEQKIWFKRTPPRPKCVCKFADWFSSFFQSLQMHCRVFPNLADSYSVKTNQEIIAAKIRFAQSKFKILHALHNLRYKRESRKTSVVQADWKVTFLTITNSFSLVTSYESCLACQRLIQIEPKEDKGAEKASSIHTLFHR